MAITLQSAETALCFRMVTCVNQSGLTARTAAVNLLFHRMFGARNADNGVTKTK